MQRKCQRNIPKEHYYSPPPPLRKPNNACKPLWLLCASLRVMSLPLKLKANELALGLAFNQTLDQQQIAHHYLSNFYSLNYLELCSSNELWNRTSQRNTKFAKRVQLLKCHIKPALIRIPFIQQMYPSVLRGLH